MKQEIRKAYDKYLEIRKAYDKYLIYSKVEEPIGMLKYLIGLLRYKKRYNMNRLKKE